MIVIPNQRLLEQADPHTSMLDAFVMADEVLVQGVGGITDLITTPGLINVDFADVKSVMWGAGTAVMGIGRASGENRAVQAAAKAMASPMLENGVEGASGVLLSVAGSSAMTLHEVNQAATAVAQHCTPDGNVIFGATVDDSLGEVIRVTVIAAGFGRPATPVGGGDRTRFRSPSTEISAGQRPAARGERVPVRADDDGDALDDLEIPDFLQG